MIGGKIEKEHLLRAKESEYSEFVAVYGRRECKLTEKGPLCDFSFQKPVCTKVSLRPFAPDWATVRINANIDPADAIRGNRQADRGLRSCCGRRSASRTEPFDAPSRQTRT